MSKIKAVILDKDGVFVDFHKLWLRVIAYRAQLIAETATAAWDQFDRVRTVCIRAMGVDEEEETIDAYAPCSMPAADVKLALKVATYLTVYSWDPNFSFRQASDIVEQCFADTIVQLDYAELVESLPGTIEKINEIDEAGLKIGVFSSDSTANIKTALDKFKLKSKIAALQGDHLKTPELYAALCKKLGVDPSETVMISDAPRDLEAARAVGARTIGVLTGVVAKENIGLLKVVADEVLGSLADLNISKLSGGKKAKT